MTIDLSCSLIFTLPVTKILLCKVGTLIWLQRLGRYDIQVEDEDGVHGLMTMVIMPISMVMIDDNDVDNKFDDGESKVK